MRAEQQVQQRRQPRVSGAGPARARDTRRRPRQVIRGTLMQGGG